MTTPRQARSAPKTAARQLAEYLRAHAAQEEQWLSEYRSMCSELPSPALRYLARLILADEERHQLIFGDLAETVFATDDLKASGTPILSGAHVADPIVRQRTVDLLERFEAREENERAALAALADIIAPGEESKLWSVLLALIAQDTEQHSEILKFMRTEML